VREAAGGRPRRAQRTAGPEVEAVHEAHGEEERPSAGPRRVQPSDGRHRLASVSVWDALTTRQIVRIVFTVAACSGLLFLLVQIRSTLLLLAIAIFLAVALGPAVDRFSVGLPRAAAILLVYVLIFCVFAGVVALVVPPVVNGASDLSHNIPGYIEDLRDNATLRDLDNKYDVTSRLQEEASKLSGKLGDAVGALQSIAAGAFNAAFQLLTILTMTFFLLLDGKRMARFALRRFGGEHEERLHEVAGRIYRSTAGYVSGALTITTINGILTFCILTILGVPFAVPLAVLMSFFGLIPLVGATIGGVIILVVTLFTDFPQATIVYGIFLIVYQQVENNVLQPFIFKRTVNVHPLAVIVGILAGSALLGVVGALVAIPVVAALQIVLREFYGSKPDPPPELEPPPAPPPPTLPPAPPRQPPSPAPA
jgi:predicted PurR-regulated permease PerM